MQIPALFLTLLLPFISAIPPTPTPTRAAVLVDRQATSRTTFRGTCHTSSPSDNIPRGICTVTSPPDSPFTALGCNNGIIDAPRLFNCSFDGSPCSASNIGIIGGAVTC